jgi:trk system potassium uptake protein TrkH
MHRPIIFRAVGSLISALGCLALLPLLVAMHYHEPLRPWLSTMAAGIGGGLGLVVAARHAVSDHLGLREGLTITCLTWALGSAMAAIGIWMDVPDLPFIDAWFEMVSGLTTTGSTIFGGWRDAHGIDHGTTLATLTHASLAWRAAAQMLGGIGIVMLSIALLPQLSNGAGYQLYRSEISGIDSSRLAPRLIDTARILLGYYLAIICATALALAVVGVEPFVACCHATAAVSTGGFSTFDDSVTGLHNHGAEWILIAAMLVGGLNFSLVITALRGRPLALWRSEEVRLYLIMLLGAWAMLILIVGIHHPIYQDRPGDLARDTLFQATTSITSTGFASGLDTVPGGWENWVPSAQLVLLMLIASGACAGSTSGGLKLVRILVMARLIRREVRRHGEPARISPITIDGRVISDDQILHVGGFIAAYVLFWVSGTLALGLLGQPLADAASGALTCLSNAGSGVGGIGSGHNFGALDPVAKAVCMMLMLLGRLEFFGVLIACSPRHWRR